MGGDEQLIQLVVFHDAESPWIAGRTDDAHIGKGVCEPFAKALERTKPRQCDWDDRRVCILPTVVPDLSERIQL